MNKGQIYQRRKEYIELILGAMLKPKTGFDSIKYGRYNKTDKEYVRLTDLRGNAVTLNITGEKLERVMEMICDYVVNGPSGDIVINYILFDDATLYSLAPLFKEVA